MDKEKELGYMEIREQICDVCHKTRKDITYRF